MCSTDQSFRAYSNTGDMALLRAVAAGQLAGAELLAGELRWREAEGLVESHADALPALTPRGRLHLQVANGECAPPLN